MSKGLKNLKDTRKALAAHISKSDTIAQVSGTISLAKSDQRVQVNFDNFDANPDEINVANGILNLDTGELRPHDREALMTQMIPVRYDRNAKAPLWRKSVLEWMEGDQELADYLQWLVSQSLFGENSHQKVYILHGNGANGKSTFCEVLAALFGDYACEVGSDVLLKKNFASNGPTPEIARLAGKRFATVNEFPSGFEINEALIKQLSGGDPVVACHKYRDPFQFTPKFKLWIRTNYLPKIKGTDAGIWRRLEVIPFRAKVTQVNPWLVRHLTDELPGILTWAVEPLIDGRTVQRPPKINAEITILRAKSDPVLYFAGNVITSGSTLSSKDLYNKLTEYCEKYGLPIPTLTRIGIRLGELGWIKNRKIDGTFWTKP